MLLPALLFVLAPQSPEAQLLSEQYEVPAREYRFIPMHIANWPATLDISYQANPTAPVRVELVTRGNLDRFVRGKPYEFLVRLSSRAASEFHQPVPDAGDYEVILINEGRGTTAVQVRAVVQFAREPDIAQYVSPVRRALIVSVSIAVFLIALLWSGLALLRGMRAGSDA